MKKITLLLFLFASITVFSQFSKTHYIPPLTCSNSIGVADQYLYISTPTTTNVNFIITSNGTKIASGTVSNNSPFVYSIGQGNNTTLITPKTSIGVVSNKGFIVEAEDLIYVSVRLNAGLTQSNSYNHAGGLVSKGNSALGKTFRLGAMLNPLIDATLLNFASILATENNTKITISNIPVGTVLTNGITTTGDLVVTLNKNESYVLALENSAASPSNSSKMIGGYVESDKPVVVNSGSFGGSNSSLLQPNGTSYGRDIGFDQIVPLEKTGKEYIFVKGLGTDEIERVQLIANEDNTEVYIDGITLFRTLNRGEYADIDGSKFTNGNLYVRTTKNVSAYQSIAGSLSPANQNLFFVPPLNCATPNVVDNIPMIQTVGNTFYTGKLNIVTETGATVTINGGSINSLPLPIAGNTNFVCYTVSNLSGNIAVKSTRQVYVSYFGTNSAATYGGYYSGFDTKPEIVTDKITVTSSNCIPNVKLKISTLSSYDAFQWYFNDDPIVGAVTNEYTPTQPGYYQVQGRIVGCPSTVPIFSDKIPVSSCPEDSDGDGANNNIDIDLDNDGILNTQEAITTLLNQSNPFLGTEYTATKAGTGTIVGKPVYGFISEIPAGIASNSTYTLTFNQPKSVSLKYINQDDANQITPASDYLNSNGEFVVSVPSNRTVTVSDPNGQLLIDTNYDGIYETGVKEFSSFEIRFRLNSTIPLVPGVGLFKFQSYLTTAITFTHKNLSESTSNKATFAIEDYQLIDTDGDGIPNLLDIDSDNDGIPDSIEAQGNELKKYSGIDTNKDGLDNDFEPGLIPIDSDLDTVKDYLDLDSDNDGIYDLEESGSAGIDINADGRIDGLTTSFGPNGLSNSVETNPESGKLNYNILNTDLDTLYNYIDLDSDNDLCYDVKEAGFADPNFDGLLGNNPIAINTKGVVTSGTNGYTTPDSNYITAGLITITSQPKVAPTCELQNAVITLTDNGGNSYQWELSTDGVNWNSIGNNATYSGITTNTLTITSVKNVMNGYKYRVQLNKTGNSCGLTSSLATLTTLALPVVASAITLKQCDDDTDGITDFNLTEKNSFVSTNYINETFSYFTTVNGANNNDPALKIGTPTAFRTGSGTVWARVENANGCFSTSKINLIVSATQINGTKFHKNFTVCDDYIDTLNDDKDGIAAFNFSTVTADVQAILPSPSSAYTVKYYKNEADALAETNEITNTSNYRNIGFPNQQQIWVRVDSNLDNACFGLGNYVTLTVEKLPVAHAIPNYKECDEISNDGLFTFNTSTLQSNLLSGQSNVTVTYFDQNNKPLPSPFPSSFATRSQIIKARVTNNTTSTNNAIPCYDETTITFIVDQHPVANPVLIPPACDDAAPSDTDGFNKFDTSTIQSTILNGQVGMVVKYYDNKGILLPSPLPNPFNTATQNVKVTVENPLNTTCIEETILQFIVNSFPNININANGDDNELVCSNLPSFFVQLNAGIQDGTPTSNYTYVWTKNGAVLNGQTAPTLDVNSQGDYTVKVTTVRGGCSRTRTITVVASDKALITNVEIEELTEVNAIKIIVTGQGDYEYSLDEEFGYYQESNFFDNVPPGIHEIFVKDKNGCGTATKTAAILGLPKYFTPNGDGINDYWKLKGANAQFNSKAIIYIFDRYGKLLNQLNPAGLGWDGTFNSQPLPSDDYWYTVKLEDGREAKGHFTLKR